jgi:hypothetical protein
VRGERPRQLMEAEAGSGIAMMIFLMVAAQTLMVGGVAVGGWKLADGRASRRAKGAAPSKRDRPRRTPSARPAA